MSLSLTEIKLPRYLQVALSVLSSAGFEAFAVGGCVRDSLLGRQPDDWDATTNATPDEMKRCFRGCHIIETGIKHGTLTVRIDGNSVEITTYRSDGDYLDHRHPADVKFSEKLEDDLSRRDFTVNAMCYTPEKGIVDIFGGRQDLKNGIIRCVGNPEKRFDEDALRIMRALRFAATLDFEIDDDTAKAIHGMKNLLHCISAERIFVELKKMLTGLKKPSIIIEFKDVFDEIFPAFRQVTEKDFADACNKIKPGNSVAVCLAVFLSPLDTDSAACIMRYLKSDRKNFDKVRLLSENKKTGLTDRKEIFDIVRKSGVDGLDELRCYRKTLSEAFCDSVILSVAGEIENGLPTDVTQLAFGGRDISALGFTGADIGCISKKLLDAVFDGKCSNSKQSLSDYINKFLK